MPHLVKIVSGPSSAFKHFTSKRGGAYSHFLTRGYKMAPGSVWSTLLTCSFLTKKKQKKKQLPALFWVLSNQSTTFSCCVSSVSGRSYLFNSVTVCGWTRPLETHTFNTWQHTHTLTPTHLPPVTPVKTVALMLTTGDGLLGHTHFLKAIPRLFYAVIMSMLKDKLCVTCSVRNHISRSELEQCFNNKE